ncbi:MAG TPA: antibiotic biosynthesis monooxygenase family protein [Candidatus Saccharimonadales bacterium]|nr:antibiotic biosynthesis monooxygenase family protein [Candidatus Saccharimonadales bacterium]
MSDSQLYVVTHIDVIPPRAAEGTELLRAHAAHLRQSRGLVRCRLLQQVLKKNHFELMSVWVSQEAYEAHLAAPSTRAFRESLHPMLGSPIDDRLHQALDG